MNKGKKVSWLFLLALIVFFAVSSGVSYFILKERFTVESPFIAQIESMHDQASGKARKDAPFRLYEPSVQENPAETGPETRKDKLLVAVEDVIRKRLEPYEVRLLDLYLDKEGTVYMDLGEEITKNFKGDAGEELDLVAGLYAGIKQTVPDIRKMKILIEGMEAESFGGHINISKPIGEEIAGTKQ
ncbi:MAG: GerMN domain-containing protein [Nitrospirota bacterium]|nr:GerMN domain-containing protein [Nitrospirota bacterium]